MTMYIYQTIFSYDVFKNMDGLTQLEQFMMNNSTNSASEKRKKAMENRSPCSSGSGSTSPLPNNRLSLFDKSHSGGSINSLGSSPGAEVKVLTGQSSLTVPDFLPAPTKVNRSTSPFRFGTRKSGKKLEKQRGLDEATSPARSPSKYFSISPQSSVGYSSFENLEAETGNVPLDSGSGSGNKKTKNPFKEFRKKPGSSPFSLNLMRSKKSSEKLHDIPCTANHYSGNSGYLHPTDSIGGFGDSGTSPPNRMPRTPPSPSQCKCRRCSILHLEECEPKEMNALFKFLRKSKVPSYLYNIQFGSLTNKNISYFCVLKNMSGSGW